MFTKLLCYNVTYDFFSFFFVKNFKKNGIVGRLDGRGHLYTVFISLTKRAIVIICHKVLRALLDCITYLVIQSNKYIFFAYLIQMTSQNSYQSPGLIQVTCTSPVLIRMRITPGAEVLCPFPFLHFCMLTNKTKIHTVNFN